MSSSNDMKQMNQAVKPQYPDCQGKQFADHPAGVFSGSDYIDVKYDAHSNEIAQDRPMHENTTAGKGNFNFSGNQYDDSVAKGGFSNYGVSVEDHGQNPVVERTSVNDGRADRGKES